MKVTRLVAAAALGAAGIGLSGCATGPNPDDPYEGFNRQMFAFNDGLDRAVLEPAARGYRAVTTPEIREGVSNVLANLGEPVTAANELLQGKPVNALGAVGRFVVNSTVGVAGIFDPASVIGVQRTKEDFGQTLGVWGVESGPYLVLPLVGSTSPRDIGGVGVDAALNPMNQVEFQNDDEVRIGIGVLGALSGREGALEIVDDVRTSTADPYAAARRFYVRDRAAAIGKPLPDTKGDEKVQDFELDF